MVPFSFKELLMKIFMFEWLNHVNAGLSRPIENHGRDVFLKLKLILLKIVRIECILIDWLYLINWLLGLEDSGL